MVIEPQGSLTLEFNQPILVDGYDMTVYEIDGDNKKTAYSSATAVFEDFCKQTYTFSNLKYGKKYAVDYSALVGISGANAENTMFEFSTSENPYDVYIEEAICSGLEVGDKITLSATSKIEDTVTIVANFFDRGAEETYIGSQIIEKDILVGSNNIEIPITKDMGDAEFIKILILDSLSTMKPLADACEIVAPKDKLKVLLIGSSMTEDTGRFLYNIAKAGGLDLEVTVKGLGGSSLSHHAANIQAELAGRTAQEALQETTDALARGEDNPRIVYFTYENGEYIKSTYNNVLLTDALKEKDYDVISINQKTSDGHAIGFEELGYILGEIRKLQPTAQLVLHQTWNAWHWSEITRRSVFTDKIDPLTKHWTAYVPTVTPGITHNNKPLTYIPAGRAFNIADNKYEIFNVKYPEGDDSRPAGALLEIEEFQAATGLYRDLAHGSYYGCYLADACWFEYLTGRIAPIVDNEGKPVVEKPDSLTMEEHIRRLELLRDVAHEAMLELKQ